LHEVEEVFFYNEEYQYLGYLIKSTGIQVDLKNIQVIKNWPDLRNNHELMSFIGLAFFYRRFVLRFNHIAWLTNQLTEGGGNTTLKWEITQ
jgi:hypothetical protein